MSIAGLGLVAVALAAQDPRGLPEAWRFVSPGALAVAVVDVDADGVREVVLSTPTADAPARAEVVEVATGMSRLRVGVDATLDGGVAAAPGVWGDFNGDGSTDELTWVGDAAARDRELRVRPGGPAGLGATARVQIDDASVPFRFGAPVPVGPPVDVDYDGYADVLMRAFLRDAGEGEQHLALHRGSAEGISRQAAWRRDFGGFGFVDATPTIVGDVDRDGYQDIVWVELYEVEGAILGSISLTRGDEDGFRDAYWTSIALPEGVTRLDGFRVAPAGDVNGDGLGDVLLLVTPDDAAAASGVWLFEGDVNYGFTFGSPTLQWSEVAPSAWLVGSPDVDLDALSDLVIGRPDLGQVMLRRDMLGIRLGPPDWWYRSTEPGFGARAMAAQVDGGGLTDLLVSDDGGVSLFLGFLDQDLDGADDADDCEPDDADVHPGAVEVWYDGTDQDCDGNDDDQDGDGYASSGDCHDTDAGLSPESEEVWYDGVDQDCDGNDDDQDGDGAAVDDDCDDEDGLRFPGAEDVPDDGVDQDCDGADAAADEPAAQGCGCASDGTSAGALVTAMAALLRRRRRL